jgi:hypothetical protein
MHVLIYKGEDYCSVMGIFFTKKGAKKVRDRLIKHDRGKYPRLRARLQQQKAAYVITQPQKGHKDVYST